jgi:hypothetical protein
MVCKALNFRPYSDIQGEPLCNDMCTLPQISLIDKGKKVKVKLSLCLTKYHAMKTYWGSGDIAPRILWPRHEMEVSAQLHAPAALTPGKERLVPIG